jgi:uncharacterized iron-regulated membrane protein
MQQPIDDFPASSLMTMAQSNSGRLAGRVKARRKLWLQIHLYLGLFIGAVLVIISLSGSLIVFATQLDAWLNADIMHANVPPHEARFRPFEEIIASAQTVIPPNGRLAGRLSLPQQPSDVFEIDYNIPPSPDIYQVFVNPYSAEVLGQRLWGTFDSCCSWHGPLMAMIYRFHDSFWLGSTGSILTGTTALLMLVSLISGIVLWWPSRGRLRVALTIKRRASKERFNYDLHKIFGIYAAVVLFILLFTGAYLSLQVPFPTQVKALVNVFSPLSEQTQLFESTPTASQMPIDIGQAVSIANQIFPEGVVTTVFLPVGDTGVFKILKHQGNKILFPSRQRTVIIDAYSGKVLYQTDQSRCTSGDIFDEWQLALHSGEAFGLTGQIIVLIAGLTPLVLYVTGIIRWLQKRKAHQLKTARQTL